ncbi:MAG TPA: GAF and ANTAR domain-containing protein [Acidimicrobiales bacterium]|nr:GAF and ANTAR domain-containing protein [Acidimicrobiales bacterium]
MSAQAGGADAEVFAEVARSLLAQEDVQQTLQKIVDLAVETLDGCDCAGITFLKGRQFSTPAASSDVPRKVDAIQYETGEGPCLDAIREHDVFRTGDLEHERRWPKFSPRAREETGVTSMVCFRLFVDGDTLGALNLYSKARDAFDDEAVAVGSVFAAHAAVALSSALHDEQMEEALQSRDVIGQAKGIIMAREGVDADEAFDMLRRASQRVNVKLRDIARQIAESAAKSGPPASGDGEQGGA